MKKIKARTLWIIIAILFVLAIIDIIIIPHTNKPLNTVLTVILIAIFLIITILIQFATYKSFSKKRTIKYKTIEFKSNDIDYDKELLDKKYKRSNRKYGFSYLKIDNKHAYKVTIVNDSDKYFNNDDESNEKANKELDRCNTFIAVELFLSVTDEALKKIPDFMIQTDKIYYFALVKTEEGNFRCLNYEKPNENHIDQFNNIINDLSLNIIE